MLSGVSIGAVTKGTGAKAASGTRVWVASSQAAVSRTVRLTQPLTVRSVIESSASSPTLRPREGLRPTSPHGAAPRSEEHTSELQSLMRISYAVFCLKKKKKQQEL